jgi:hypothetical protein
MWIAVPGGFVSIVEKEEDQGADTLTVRARDRESLVEFCRLANVDASEVQEKTETDYPFRLRMWRHEVEQAMITAVAEIQYSNFKNAAATARGKQSAFTRFLGRIWYAGLTLTPKDVARRGGSVYYE